MRTQNHAAERGKGGRCALSHAQEVEVLSLIGTKTMVSIAEQFGVHRNTIKNIKDRYQEEAPHPSTETRPTDNTARAADPSIRDEPDQSQKEAL